MRRIFSCMWPNCTRNCDSLEDIERHVRAHLGPKQYDSIGDEDFYYEETEVDEATYLAIFSRSSALPLSPGHNSDGLSSGQSFASSSPATSPVCSTDSSSSLSASCFSTSSCFGLAGASGGGGGGGLIMSNQGVTGGGGGGGVSNGHQAAGHLYAADSIDWNNFLLASNHSRGRHSTQAATTANGVGSTLQVVAPPKTATTMAEEFVRAHSPATINGQISADDSAQGHHGSAHHRRVRGENRKCRKVYGMERRDVWCTQCKWKKACSRFCDQQ